MNLVQENDPFPDWEDFQDEVANGLSQVFSSPSGAVRLGIHPREGLGQIIQKGKHGLPATRGRAHLSSEHIILDGDPWTLLNVTGLAHNEIEDAYALLTLIGRTIENGANIGKATANALEVMGHLLARERRMSFEEEIGLIAELLFLHCAVDVYGLDVSLTGWTGPEGGNHDFEFSFASFEIKATRSPERRHRISSEYQLETIPLSPLRLASFQFAASADNAGIHLPTLIDELLNKSEHLSDKTAAKLRLAGWTPPRDGITYGYWKVSSRPLEFVIHDRFPRLTRHQLALAVENIERLSDVTYTVHLENFASSEPLVLTDSALEDLQ